MYSMIPKRVYYCWLGNPDNMSLYHHLCIESWKRVLPDYEIIKLDDNDVDMSIEFNRKKRKKPVLVSDLLKFKLMSENTGIYLDTDIFMLKPFSEDILESPGFIGAEIPQMAGTAILGSGQVGIKLFKGVFDIYNNFYNNNTKLLVNPLYQKIKLKEIYGINKMTDDILYLDDINIYPRDYFFPLCWNPDYPFVVSNNTTCIHLWEGTWKSSMQGIFRSYYENQDRMREFFSTNYPDAYNNGLDIIINDKVKMYELHKECKYE